MHHDPTPERGAVLVVALGAMVMALGMAALAIDVGWLLLNGWRAQRAADAAALAGVVHLPGEEDVAFDVARVIAASNGYVDDSLGGPATVDPSRIVDNQHRLRVDITEPVETFFMKVFGIETVDVTRAAIAEFVPPLPLGSPLNVFGNDPDTGFTPNFWGNIHGRRTDTVMGDAFSSACRGDNSCSGAAPHPNPTFRESGYLYGVEVPAGTTSLTIELFDGPFTQNGGSEVQEVYTDATGGTLRLTFEGQTTTPFGFAAAAGAVETKLEQLPNVGDVAVTGSGTAADPWVVSFADPGSTNLDQMTADDSGLVGGTTTIMTVNDGGGTSFGDDLVKTGDHNTCGGCSGPGPTVEVTLYRPDPTPLNVSDNEVAPGCRRDYPPQPEALGFQWRLHCSPPAPIAEGVWPLQIRISDGIPGEQGLNRFSIRATASGGQQPRLYGLGDMSVFANVAAGTSDFFLAEVSEVHAGKDFIVELYDPGDATGTNKLTLIAPGGGSPPCSIEVRGGGAVASDLPGGCRIDATGRIYNGLWLEVVVALPADYECDPVAYPGGDGCWWKINYNYTQQATDTTTWTARIAGSPIHLILDQEA